MRAALLVACLLAAGCGIARETDRVLVDDPELRESSGVAPSRRHPGLLWTHNDSGDAPRLFAVGTDGTPHGSVVVPGAQALDWEDMASAMIDGRPLLVVGDVGDNFGVLPLRVVYVLEEPERTDGGGWRCAEARAIAFHFEDGPRDCEALAIDVARREILLASKRATPPALYALPLDHGDSIAIARKVAELPQLRSITAMDLSRDGTVLALVGGDRVFLVRRSPGEAWAAACARRPQALPRVADLRQCEALCFAEGARALWLTSEGTPMPLVRLPIDD